MNQSDNHLYEFGPFRLDLSERQLFRKDKPVSLTPKAFETTKVGVPPPQFPTGAAEAAQVAAQGPFGRTT